MTDESPKDAPDETDLAGQPGGDDPSGEPGPLRADIWLTLHTRKAQELVRGRPGTEGRQPIIGLGLFADRLRLIWQAARDDDPYADWWLIKIHEAIAERETQFERLRQDLDEKLAQMGGIHIAVPESVRPYRMPLRFASPYAYQAARLVATYDELSRTVLAACHVGALDRAGGGDVIRLGARRLRSLFLIPMDYRSLGIDRASVLGGLEKPAARKMGPLPDAVLRGERRAPLAPERRPVPPAVDAGPERSGAPEPLPRLPAPTTAPSPEGNPAAEPA